MIGRSIVASATSPGTDLAVGRIEEPKFSRLQSVTFFVCGLMAFSGSLKEVPPFSLSSVDLTLMTTITAVGLALLYTILIGSLPVGRAAAVLLLLLCVAAAGSIVAIPTEYAAQKASRIFIVTLPAALAILLAVRNHIDAYRFTRMLLILAVAQSFFINIGGQRQYGFGRLTTEGGTTISFGRAAGFVVVAAAAWLMSSRQAGATKTTLILAVAGFEVWTVLAIASKGPILGMTVALAAMLILQLHRIEIRTAVRLTFLVAVMTTAMTIVWFQIPELSRQRLTLFGSDGSTDSRQEAWDFTWQNLSGSLIGNGWGSWDVASPIPIVYPHNLLLEVWFEAGLIGLIAFIAAFWIAARNQDRIFTHDYFRGTLGLGVVIYWLTTAMVSGELNDNKVLVVLLIAGAAPLLTPDADSEAVDDGDDIPDERSMSLAELVVAAELAHSLAREPAPADLVGSGVGVRTEAEISPPVQP
ncbi:MAG: O-antigen ligase family protein [Actinomycetia bacterium]|nr:O-antigen ligase family protein [Actinomycetes bacterium]